MLCDEFGIIIEMDEPFAELLEYKPNELVGSFIGKIMSPFLSFFHETYLLPMYRSMNKEERTHSHGYLASQQFQSKPMFVYKKSGVPICLHLSVHFLCNTRFYMKVYDVVSLQSDMIYTSDIKPPEMTQFSESHMNMVVISIDMKDSTLYLVENGAEQMISIHKQFHQQIVTLLKTTYYPYMYLHEIMGDGFILVMNVEWTFNFERFCASMAYSFLNDLYKNTRLLLQFRAGVSYSKLHYGYIDKRLRFFGEGINLAARYESHASVTTFVTDLPFYEKLVSEGMMKDINYRNDSVHCKGFGQRDVIHIQYEGTNHVNSPIVPLDHRFKFASLILQIVGTPIIKRTSIKNSNTNSIESSLNNSPISYSNPISYRNPISMLDNLIDQLTLCKKLMPYSDSTKAKWSMMTDEL